MVDSNKDLVASLEQKIDLLLLRYQGLKDEVKSLDQEKRRIYDQLQSSSEKLADLQVRYDSLKLAKTLELTQGDAHEAKLKINQMVREIDKCIALLNR
jgi:predicted  nucleic acid-binding Zn-ribbon protein